MMRRPPRSTRTATLFPYTTPFRSLTLRGPFDYADASDLAGGTSAEDSGPARAAWQAARLAMLGPVSAMQSAVFPGGYHGPWMPGPVWVLVKVGGVLSEPVRTAEHGGGKECVRKGRFRWWP